MSDPAPPTKSRKPRQSLYTLLGVPRRPSPSTSTSIPTFDPAHKWVTSPIFRNPFVFAGLRLLTAVYILISLIMFLEINVKEGEGDAFFSYFTNLGYVGLCAYFFASGLQTLFYALRWRRNGAGAGYPLRNSWPRSLQALHVVLYTTVVTFPFIVTAVYWALLADGLKFDRPKRSWNAISVHVLNAVYAACELVFTNSPPAPWIAMPLTVLILCGYLGVAYITHETQGFYTYSFLDPTRTGKLLAAYVVGIAAGQCILFTLVHFIAVLRERLAVKYRRVIVLDPPASRKGKEAAKGRKTKKGGEGEEGDLEAGKRRDSEEDGEEDEYLDIDESEWEPVTHPNMSRPEVVGVEQQQQQKQQR